MEFTEDYDYFIEECFDIDPFRQYREGFGSLLLEACQIKNYATFNNRSFSGKMSFRNTVFCRSPQFHNCEFHEDVSFDGTKFLDVSSEDSSRNYRALRLQMENLRSRHLEARFFRLEQLSLRKNKNMDFGFKFFSIMYQASSEYGYSISRPIGVFIFLNIVFAIIYHISLMPLSDFPEGLNRTTSLALSQTINPVGVVSDPEKFKESLDIVFGVPEQITALFQAILNFGLLASFLIALRRRFRIS